MSSPRRPVRVVVVGAGFGGLGAAAALRRAGITDVTVLERADEVGGVWRDNTYPGAACDVPSPLYSWSWAPNPAWRRRYAEQPDILAYLRSAAADAGLLDLVETGRTVTRMSFDEERGRWSVETAEGPSPRDGSSLTSSGQAYEADLVVSAVGQLSNPVVPDLPGVGDFAGEVFHSARWRHDVDLRGRRVAVVGTGASAIQFVPGIVDRVASMTVFQRSAPYVVPKPDQAYSPRHSRAFRRWPALLRAERRLVYWIGERYAAALTADRPANRALLRAVRTAWRVQLRRQVRDRRLRAALVPDHPLGCKRLLFSNDWYRALDRDHVRVETARISRVEPAGVRTDDGVLHEAEVLIWGTGFAATDFLAGVEVTGLGGSDLHRGAWRDGATAHLGLTVPGFPNLFLVYGPHTNLGSSSIIAMMEAQASYVASVAARMARGEVTRVEVERDVADRFQAEMDERLERSAWATCDSWYREAGAGKITTNWPGLVAEYEQRAGTVAWDDLRVS